MSALTTRLSLYKPGGGSTGTILPDETADIDKLNDNADIIDDAIGNRVVTSVTRPASPFDGQPIFETDTKRIRVYRQTGATWDTGDTMRGDRTIYAPTNLAALDTISDALIGDLAFMSTPGTGIGALKWEAFSGSGSTIDWRIIETVIADTKANLDAFITAVAAISGTDAQFRIGGLAFVTGTNLRYRFTSTAGALIIDGRQRITEHTVSGTGVTKETSGLVKWTNGQAASPLVIDGCFPDGFSQFFVSIKCSDLSAGGGGLTFVFRTAAPADDGTTNYQHTEGLDRNATSTSSTIAAAASLSLTTLNAFYHCTGEMYNVNEAKATLWDARIGSSPNPQVSGTTSLIASRMMTHNAATIMRGFKLTVGGNFTGTVEINIEGIPD